MNIACCGIDREQFHAAEQACGCPVLYFVDAPDRRGDVRLAYALRDGVPIRLAVVGYQGAAGLTARSEERRVGKECRSRWSPYH